MDVRIVSLCDRPHILGDAHQLRYGSRPFVCDVEFVPDLYVLHLPGAYVLHHRGYEILNVLVSAGPVSVQIVGGVAATSTPTRAPAGSSGL